MSGLDFVRAALLPELLAIWLAALLAVLAGRALARRRSRRLLGPEAARSSAAGDMLLLAALGALLLALLGPRFGERVERVRGTGVDVVLLFDVSQSMRARDVPPSRLERARELGAKVLDGLAHGDRAALAAFAGRGVLLTPLTPDAGALRALIPALDESLLSEGGSRFDDGVRAALSAFRAESARPRAILLLSDGEDPEDRDALGLEALAPSGTRVVAALFGGEAGATIPLRSGPLEDASGRPVVTRADAERLRRLAEPTGGTLFVSDRFGSVDAAAVLAALRRDAELSAEGFVLRRVPRSGATALAALALLALLGEAWLARRRSASTGALMAPAATRARLRAGAALGALLLVGTGSDAERAAEQMQPEAQVRRSAERLEREAEVRRSAERLEREAEVRRAPGDARALVRLGLARAADGEAEEAERAFFAAAVRAGEPEVAADAYYDLGVSALGRGDLEVARDAFFDAIALQSGDRAAQFNLEWTLRALASQPPPPSEGGKPQPQDSGSPQEGEPDPEGAPPPGSEPEPDSSEADTKSESSSARAAGPEATRAPAEPGDAAPRENPVRLDPEAAQQWLESVADDPARALRAAAGDPERGRKRRRGAAPLW